jgi:hypothetical protein
MNLANFLKYLAISSFAGYIWVQYSQNKKQLAGNPVAQEKGKKIFASLIPWLGMSPQYEPVVRTIADKAFDTMLEGN